MAENMLCENSPSAAVQLSPGISLVDIGASAMLRWWVWSRRSCDGILLHAFCYGSGMLPILHTLLFWVRGLRLDIGKDVVTMKTEA